MGIIEKILIKLSGNTVGHDFNMWDWDVMTLAKKCMTNKPFTKSEIYAKKFLEKVGTVINYWDSPKKLHKEYEFNEKEKRM